MIIVLGGTMRRIRTSHLWLTTACLATSTAAQTSLNIFQRTSSCGDPTYTQCSQAGLPSDFCCAPSSDCIVLAANTTVLCCPSGSSCSTIKAIPCDLSSQNVTANPDISLMTTALSATLPTCGSLCCPFGYSCNSAGDCSVNSNQDVAPTASSAASISTPTSSNAATSVTPVACETNSPATSCSKFPVTAILVGFFPGLLLGVLLSAASVCFIGRRGRKASRRQSGSSFGNISDPQPQSDMRTDFLRKPPQTPSTDASTMVSRQPTVQRVRSLFRKSSTNAPLRQSPRPAPPIPDLRQSLVEMSGRPVTPVLQREPSYGDINIFADGDTASALRENERQNSAGRRVRESHQTTFSDMMEKSGLAGLQKGQRESPTVALK
jgi:hypothetical protein